MSVSASLSGTRTISMSLKIVFPLLRLPAIVTLEKIPEVCRVFTTVFAVPRTSEIRCLSLYCFLNSMPFSIFSWLFVPKPSREIRRFSLHAYSSSPVVEISSLSQTAFTFFGPIPGIVRSSRISLGNADWSVSSRLELPLSRYSRITSSTLFPIPFISVNFPFRAIPAISSG
ncbi:hypothetical protein ES703_56805 [subsurface metagenome]